MEELMQRISTADLRDREVINLCDGERLGYPVDFELDPCDGKIISIIVSSCGGVSLFGKRDEYVIPWCEIQCIGEDAILVKIEKGRLSSCECNRHGGKKSGFFR